MIFLLMGIKTFGYENLPILALSIKVAMAIPIFLLLLQIINKFRVMPYLSFNQARILLTQVKPFIKIGIISAFLKNVDKIIITKMLSLELYAIYEIVLQTISRISVIGAFSNRIAMPEIVRNVQLKENKEYVWLRLSTFSVVLTWPIFTLVYYKSEFLFSNIFSIEDRDFLHLIILPLTAIYLINSRLRVNNTIYISHNKEGDFLRYSVITAAVYLVVVSATLYYDNIAILLLGIAFSSGLGLLLTTLGFFSRKVIISTIFFKLISIANNSFIIYYYNVLTKVFQVMISSLFSIG